MSFPVDSTPVAPAVPAPLEPGTVIRHLRLLSCAWEDLDGFVYAAEHVDTGQKVLLKEFCPAPLARRTGTRVEPLPGLGSDYSRLLARFIVVTNQMSCLEHPGLMRVKDYWLQDGTVYVEMPWYDSHSLRQELDQHRQAGRPVDPEQIAHWLRSIAAALQGLYRSQDMHGGLAPERIQLLADGRVLLSPLSAEWPIRLMLPLTMPSVNSAGPEAVAGSTTLEGSPQDPHIALPAWLALEQTGLAHHIRHCGPWSDVYALSAIAASAITGTPPPNVFVRQRHPEIAADYLEDLRLAGLQHDHPATFMSGLEQALSLHPEQRPRSIPALLETLGITPTIAPAPSPAPPDGETLPAFNAKDPVDAVTVSHLPITPPASDGPVQAEASDAIAVFSTFDNTPSVSTAPPVEAITSVLPAPPGPAIPSPRAQGAAMWGEGPGWSVWLSALVALLTLVYLVPKAYPPGTWAALHQFSTRPSTAPDTPALQAEATTPGATSSAAAASAAAAAPATSTATANHRPKQDAKHDAKQDVTTPHAPPSNPEHLSKLHDKVPPKPTNPSALEKSKDTAKDTAAASPKRPDPHTAPSTQTRVSQACADALMRQSLDPNAGESRQTPAACR